MLERTGAEPCVGDAGKKNILCPCQEAHQGSWCKCQTLRNTQGAAVESPVTSYMEHQGILQTLSRVRQSFPPP